MKRRTLLTGMIAFAGIRLHAQEGPFEITRAEAEWRKMLTDAEFAVMRE